MIKIYDRIKQTTYSVGTGDIALSGAIPGFSKFSSVYQNNDPLFYCITDGTNYEIGSGVYLSSSDSIKRFCVRSTNNNQVVNFGYGLKEIYVNYPATNAVFNTIGINSTPENSGLAFWTSSNSLSYSNKLVVDSGNGRIGINKNNPMAAIDIGGSSATSNIKASGFIVGNSGIYFPSGNNGFSSYSGGVQLTHFEMNKLDSNSSSVLQLSGVVNQNILLKKQNAGTFFAGPSGGCEPPCLPGYPTFRPLVAEDIPDLSHIYANVLNLQPQFSDIQIGDEYSSTYLTIDLPAGLPDVVNRDINAISINNGADLFAVNGLGEIKYATIDAANVTNIDSSISSNVVVNSISGILNTRIHSASGLLNTKIDNASGYLDTKINAIQTPTIPVVGVLSEFRISQSSTDPLAEGSSTGIYIHPYTGNNISLFDGTSWQSKTFSSTLVINSSSILNNTNYDLFVYLNGNALSFEYLAWSNNSDRNIDVTLKDGVYCKNTDKTRRYIGTVRMSSGSFHNTNNKRFIFNPYHRVKRLYGYEPTISSWSLVPSLDFTEVGALNTGALECVYGLPETLDANATVMMQLSGQRSSYNLFILDQRWSEYVAANGGIFEAGYSLLYNWDDNVTAIGKAFFFDGDYNDAIVTIATAQLTTKFIGYYKVRAMERVSVGNSPTLSIDLDHGAVGLSALSYQ